MSNVLLFQFHDYIATEILKQDPHSTNYWGNKRWGISSKLMYPGTVWIGLASEKYHREDFSAKPMMNYFAPLMEYLKKQNAGRKYTLPEKQAFN
jgi:peptidyl-dipeptidase A